MASEATIDTTELKTRELLKEVRLDYSPAFTKLVDDAVSAIRDSIDKIPQDLQVLQLSVIVKIVIVFLWFFVVNYALALCKLLVGCDCIRIPVQVTADFAPSFVRDIGADKVDFKFRKPKSVEIGGSYAIQCIAKPDVNVDLFIRLPKVFG